MLAVEGDPSIPVKFITFNLTGGATRNYNIIRTGVQPVLSENFPTNINLIKRGSIFSDYNINNLSEQFARNSRPKFDVVKGEEEKNTLPLYITIKNHSAIKKIIVNNISRSDLVGKNQILLNQQIKDGENIFAIELVDDLGNSTNKKILHYKESLKEIEARKSKEREEDLRIANLEKLRLAEEARIAKEGDGSTDDLLCKKYGLKPQTSGYAECRMRIDFAKTESKRQQEQFEREQAVYERQLAAIEREKNRRRNAALMELGGRMMGGQSPIEALNSLETGAPIAPIRTKPINQTITLPGGRMINCTTIGTMTNCF